MNHKNYNNFYVCLATIQKNIKMEKEEGFLEIRKSPFKIRPCKIDRLFREPLELGLLGLFLFLITTFCEESKKFVEINVLESMELLFIKFLYCFDTTPFF